MDRRRFLSTIGVGVTGSLAGCVSQVSESASEMVGPPEKGEKLGERSISSYSGTFITKVEIYEGGWIDVTLTEDHDMQRIGLVHNAVDFGSSTEPLSDSYRTWDLPEFSGPESYYIKGPIMNNNDAYPSNIFKLKVAPEEGSLIFTTTQRVASFPVPESFVPDGTTIEEEL